MSSVAAKTYGIEVRGQGVPEDCCSRLPGNVHRHIHTHTHVDAHIKTCMPSDLRKHTGSVTVPLRTESA